MQPDTPSAHPASSQPPASFVEVWDLPIRICHWGLVGLFATAVASGKIGGDAMEIHMRAGYGIVVLVAFRLLWGFVGTPPARFANFVRGIPAVIAYGRKMLRGEAYAHRGHNPLGGWMVVAMLVALALQAGTGLFANDDIMAEGPLANLVAKDTSDTLTAVHKLNFAALAVLAGLHVAAIAFYRLVKRIDLLRPMISGRIVVSGEAGQSFPRHTNLLALAVLGLVAAAFYLLLPAA